MKRLHMFVVLFLFLHLPLTCKNAHLVDWIGSTDACIGNYDNFRCSVDTLATKRAFEKHNFTVYQVGSFPEIENPDVIVFFDTNRIGDPGNLKKFPHAVNILITREPPTLMPLNFSRKLHQFFDFIFTWHDDFIDNQKYFKQHYAVWGPMIDSLVDFDQKKLCVMITANKGFPHPQELYSERKRAVDFFERFHPDDFDLYGISWENSKYYHYKTYKGPIPFVGSNPGGNLDHLSRYKFCICYENSKDMPGYISQRIFDCFRAGCVPVYWGAPNIEKYIPKSCFVAYHDFSGYDDLYHYLTHMQREEYENYIKNIKGFLKSEAAQLFTMQHFQESFEELVIHSEKKIEQKKHEKKGEL